jgi:chromosome segregation ATPase
VIEHNVEKLNEIDEFIKEAKQELKDCRIVQAKLQSQLDQEVHEESQLKSRLERLSNQRHFLSGLLEGLRMVMEGN